MLPLMTVENFCLVPLQRRKIQRKMLRKSFVLAVLAFASASDKVKNSKRSSDSFDFSSWNSLLGNSWPSHYPWQPIPLAHGYPISTSYSGKSHFNIGIFTTHDVAAAFSAAKEATAAAALAQQRVQAAREQVIIQERVAAAKEAAAHAAIQRSQVAAAIQKSEALEAAVHKSAVAAKHFSGPWIHSKTDFNHWG